MSNDKLVGKPLTAKAYIKLSLHHSFLLDFYSGNETGSSTRSDSGSDGGSCDGLESDSESFFSDILQVLKLTIN
jgi:hypothetical protein